jgi:DNA polymerase III subunit alpha, Gram-positive type
MFGLKMLKILINNQTDFGKIRFYDIIACRDDIMVQLTEMGLEPLKGI